MATFNGPNDSKISLDDGAVRQLQALNLLTQTPESELFKRAIELLKIELVPTTNPAAKRGRKPGGQP